MKEMGFCVCCGDGGECQNVFAVDCSSRIQLMLVMSSIDTLGVSILIALYESLLAMLINYRLGAWLSRNVRSGDDRNSLQDVSSVL